MDKVSLPLPAIRCLSKEEAARYLGIGVTLLAELEIPVIKLGRRCLYDRVDLDAWIKDYKQREYGRGLRRKIYGPNPRRRLPEARFPLLVDCNHAPKRQKNTLKCWD